MARRKFSEEFPDHKRLWNDLAPTSRGKTGVNEILTDPKGLGISSERLLKWRKGEGTITDSEAIELRRIHGLRNQLRSLWPIREQGGKNRRSYESRRKNVRKLYRAWDTKGDWRKQGTPRSPGSQSSQDIMDALIGLGVDPHRPETYVTAYYGDRS